MSTKKPLTCLLVVAVLACTVITACKKDKTAKQVIIGSWINVSNYGGGSPTNQVTYQFNSDNTVVSERTLYDATTNKLMGYSTRTEAQYELKGDSIRFYNSSSYNYPTQPYYSANKQDLTLVNSNQSYTSRIVFESADSFHFQYNCPPNALCAAILTYSRQASH